MNKKRNLIMLLTMSSSLAVGAVALNHSLVKEVDAAENSYTIKLTGANASNCHFDEENYLYYFDLVGKTGSGEYDFSSMKDYTYFGDYSGLSVYEVGGDDILYLGNPNASGNFVYIYFDFEGPGTVTEAYAVIKENGDDDYKYDDLVFDDDGYTYSAAVNYNGYLFLHEIVFKYTC